MRKIVSFMLVLCLLCNISFVSASANEIQSNNIQIIGYMKGVPITVEDINEDGRVINRSKLEKIFPVKETKNSISSISTLAYGDNLYVPIGTNVYLEKVLTTTGFSQTTYDMYFTPTDAREYATEMTMSTAETIAWFLAGLVKAPYGTVAAVCGLLKGLYANSVASDIRSYADYDIPVFVSVVKSNYGTFYGVNEWDGRTIDMSTYNDPPMTTEEITCIYFD